MSEVFFFLFSLLFHFIFSYYYYSLVRVKKFLTIFFSCASTIEFFFLVFISLQNRKNNFSEIIRRACVYVSACCLRSIFIFVKGLGLPKLVKISNKQKISFFTHLFFFQLRHFLTLKLISFTYNIFSPSPFSSHYLWMYTVCNNDNF